MSTETALPPAEEAQASTPPEQLAPTTEGQQSEQTDPPVEKKEKTPEQRALEKAQRVIDRRTRQREELRAEVMQLRQQIGYAQKPNADTNAPAQDDDQPVTLTRKQIEALVTERASKLAPEIKQIEAVTEQRRSVAQGLVKQWGQEKFEAITSDLDEVLGGMADANGQLKPITEAILESEMPAGLVEYLADPENADEAEALGRMNALQAGRAVAKLEAKLKTEAAVQKAKAKPERSDAPEPIERLKGSGQPSSSPSDTDSIDVWVKKERARLAAKNKGN